MTTTYSNFGPLTTPFTPAASCSSYRNQIYTLSGTVTTIWFRQGGHSDCYPGTVMYDYHYGVGSYGVQNLYFSPAFDCPSGWGTSATLMSSSNAVDEQAYICCPSGYTWTYEECLSTATNLSPLVRNETLDGFTWIEGGYETRSYTPNDANNWPIEIHFRESDLNGTGGTTSSGSSPTSASSVASPGSVSSTTTGAQATANGTDTGPSSSVVASSSSNGGLSTGAKIAIGVVIPVVVLAAVIGVFLFFRRRRRARQQVETWPQDTKTPELGGERSTQTAELDSRLDQHTWPVELGAERRRLELPGSPGIGRAELE